ncbi:hypothetical protein CAXC1_180066 [Candidatus Xenohaliotis californiensis]|uniref:Uncharacterized protein n=1 Tax=Candidatus Xenohaliotis californiensis TaxID=84677 RepID=A0ABM9N7J6_9RICK|nr:hypothetical protein CAXC1_180066 [Candidatus Xenohaliotis californiensis]
MLTATSEKIFDLIKIPISLIILAITQQLPKIYKISYTYC